MDASKQTKDEWIEEQKGGLLLACILVSMFLMGLFGLFAFGVGCIFLDFRQAFGCGITASVLTFLISGKIVGRNMKRELYKKAETMQFRDQAGSAT